MHPKNPYKTPPDFKELAKNYPEFQKFATPELTGKVLIDFKDPAALRALTTSLLHRDFNLDVTIPEDRLVPTLPLRLNYLLWISDLLQLDPAKREHVHAIDVGTGACCIYPLLGATMNDWRFLATEIELVNYESAKLNVEKNNLSDKIQVKFTERKDSLLLGNIHSSEYAFCMTNPPFFSTLENGNPTANRKSRKEANFAKLGGSSSPLEVSCEGGEVEFVKKLITESIELQNQIGIYTTMLGHKASLAPLKNFLIQKGISNFCQTEFSQGKTIRWGIAWTFQTAINLKKAPVYEESKPKPPVTYIIEDLKKFEHPTIACVAAKLIECFKNLKMKVQILKKNKYMELVEVSALENTWSHLRRKRREDMRKNSVSEEPPNKKIKEEEISQTEEEVQIPEASNPEPKEILIQFHARLQNQNDVFSLQLIFMNGTLGRDALQQILQYLKNNLFHK